MRYSSYGVEILLQHMHELLTLKESTYTEKNVRDTLNQLKMTNAGKLSLILCHLEFELCMTIFSGSVKCNSH